MPTLELYCKPFLNVKKTNACLVTCCYFSLLASPDGLTSFVVQCQTA